MHCGNMHLQRRWRVRSRRRDLDQIDVDMRTRSAELINQTVDLGKSGFGQFYYLIDDTAMRAHFHTKVHRRRLKAPEWEPYNIEESERATGHGSFRQVKQRGIEAQPTKDEVKAGKSIKVEQNDT